MTSDVIINLLTEQGPIIFMLLWFMYSNHVDREADREDRRALQQSNEKVISMFAESNQQTTQSIKELTRAIEALERNIKPQD